MSNVIQQGDKCWVKTTKKHYGVCTGRGEDGKLWFVHNTRVGGVIHSTLKGFAGNKAIFIEKRAAPGHERNVANRALSLVGREYHMLSFNCEHMANLAANGTAESRQVQAGAVWATLTLMFSGLLAAIVNENGTSVDTNGYRRNGNGKFAKRLLW